MIRTRLADAAATLGLLAGLVVLLTAWPVSCLRNDGLSVVVGVPKRTASLQVRVRFANFRVQPRPELAAPSAMNRDVPSLLRPVIPAKTTRLQAGTFVTPAADPGPPICRLTLSQRDGQILLSQVGPLSAWWDGGRDDFDLGPRVEHRPNGEPATYATDTAGNGWAFGGFDMADTTTWPGPNRVPHRAVAVPHWFAGLILLLWPALRFGRRLRRRATVGFDVIVG